MRTNGVNLRCVVEGDGPLIILMHGWPQCWYLWRHQIDPLVAQGWKVCVPDQRGYGYSECPPNIDDYRIRDLAADIDGLATALGYDEYVDDSRLGCPSWLERRASVPRSGSNCRRHVGALWAESRSGLVYPRVWETTSIGHFSAKNIGGAETHFEEDIRRSLLTVHLSASGDSGPSVDPKGKRQCWRHHRTS